MEDTDIDMVISIPDTPERPIRRGSVISREVKRRPHSPEAPVRHQREEYRRTRPPVPEIGENRENPENRHHHRSRGSGSNALFRRTAVEKDKGKSISTDPCVARVEEKNPVLNGHVHFTTASGREFRTSSNGCSSSPLRGDRNSFNLPGNSISNKGKEKVECGSVSNRETIDISSGKPQNRGTKRLVRNGCISPHAIAARARIVTDTVPPEDTVSVVEQEQEIAVLETVPSIDIREIVSGNNIHERARGKRPEIPRSSRDGAEGWFSTRNRKLSIGNEMMNQRDESDTSGICSSVSRLDVHEIGEVEREARQQRRRKNGVSTTTTTSRGSNKPEVSVIGSSGEPSSSRPPRIYNHRSHATQVLEIEDSSPEVRVTRGPRRRVENDESVVKARQMEADEILARELQEELYRESTMMRDEQQIDENIARLLEQEENALRASSSRASTRNTRISNTSAANPGGRSRLEARLQQHSTRRRSNLPPTQARAPIRAPPRVRGQHLGRVHASLHSALNRRFPNDMALESRMDFLEELENVFRHSFNNHSLLHMDRDFTEDDYEMLLALDENNHRHGGASSHRINNLPESTVQSDNYQETCVICLETPTIGDTIRHLPCLHKFHKDCIDPWLGRSKACPVCKSSVT